MKFGKITSALATAALLASLFGSARAEDKTVFRVAYLPTANYLTTIRTTGIMEDKLKAVGADAKFVGPLDPFTAYNTVTSGEADASSTGTGYFVNLSAQKSNWVAFALEKYSGNSQGIVAAPDSGVSSLKDLYGKKVGIDGEGATGDYILNLAFKEAGLDVSKVEKVTLDTTSFATAFASSQVAAIASYDQNLANAIATEGAKILVTADKLHSYNWSIHIVSRDFAEKHPEALKAAYEALVAESDRAQKNPKIITDAYKEFGAADGLIKVVSTFDTPKILPMNAGRRFEETWTAVRRFRLHKNRA